MNPCSAGSPDGPQAFHATIVPQVGGIGIFLDVLAAVGLLWLREPEIASSATLLMLYALPACRPAGRR